MCKMNHRDRDKKATNNYVSNDNDETYQQSPNIFISIAKVKVKLKTSLMINLMMVSIVVLREGGGKEEGGKC